MWFAFYVHDRTLDKCETVRITAFPKQNKIENNNFPKRMVGSECGWHLFIFQTFRSMIKNWEPNWKVKRCKYFEVFLIFFAGEHYFASISIISIFSYKIIENRVGEVCMLTIFFFIVIVLSINFYFFICWHLDILLQRSQSKVLSDVMLPFGSATDGFQQEFKVVNFFQYLYWYFNFLHPFLCI